MKVGIMQPYFFPYIGYWQLINAVDRYVIYDDVNYIKSGWINRNTILIGAEGRPLTLQLQNSSSNKLINEINVLNDLNYTKKMLKTIEISYKKAPYFMDVFPLVEEIITQNEKRLADYLGYSIRKICDFLKIDTEIIISSKLVKRNELKGQDKVIEICKILGASEYFNAYGGQSLYSYDAFASNNIRLHFLKTKQVSYPQFNNSFVSNLSIMDVMMFNSIENMKILLGEYDLK